MREAHTFVPRAAACAKNARFPRTMYDAGLRVPFHRGSAADEPSSFCEAPIVRRTLLLVWLFAASCFAQEKPQLWLYYATNLAVDKNVDQAREVWARAAAAGYDHVLLTDSKFAKLGDLGEMTP